MKVYLFRHGQTPGNAAHRYLGITDEPLSELGMETARMTGSDLTVGEVLVSPLKRTQMTAAILFPNAKQRVCDSFREMDFGDFEGRSAQEMENDADFRYWVEKTQCMGPCSHGDATVVFQHRVATAFRREVEKALAAGKESLYLVVHGGVIMTVLYRFGRPQAPFYDWPLDNCQGYCGQVVMGPDGLELHQIRHLPHVGS